MRLIVPIIVFLITGALAHVFVLGGIPGFIMGKAHQTFAAQGIPAYQFVASPRQTPQTQRIVRPSPDLAYAICRFDTTQGPVFINAPKGQSYGSLSIFNSQTDNVFVANLGPESDFSGIEVRRAAANTRPDALALNGRGIALIRRLAPTQEAHDLASALVSDSTCERLE